MIERIENTLITPTDETQLSRRRFLSVSGKYGFNVAVLASMGGYCGATPQSRKPALTKRKRRRPRRTP